jgi:prepilin-type N-terminal cleavage/methylation domain-containing protein
LISSIPASGRVSRTHGAAFTLVEIVIVMTILAVLAAASVPTFRGLAKEREARAPLVALVDMAKTARLRAMKEKRPYQIAFTAQGFTGSRYVDPYLTYAALEEFVMKNTAGEAATPPAAEDDAEASSTIEVPTSTPAVSDTAAASPDTAQGSVAPAVAQEWLERSSWPQGATVRTLVWHDIISSEEPLQGEKVVLWVFQPSGICEPLFFRLEFPSGSLSADFGALTADIVRESSSF